VSPTFSAAAPRSEAREVHKFLFGIRERVIDERCRMLPAEGLGVSPSFPTTAPKSGGQGVDGKAIGDLQSFRLT
jgi:hypothetical protein